MSALTKSPIIQRLLYSGAALNNRTSEEQAFVVNVYSLLAFASLVCFGLQHVFLASGSRVLGYVEIIGGLIIALNFWGFRMTKNIVLARNILLFTMLSLLLVMLYTGGLAGTGIFWFFVFPVSAFFLTNKRSGMGWMTALLLAILAALLVDRTTFLHIAYSPITVQQLMITLLVVSVGIYAYQQSRETLVEETERSEDQSQEEKIKNETIIENIDEGIVAVDPQGIIVIMNEPAEEMLGWRRQELVGKKFIEAVPLVDQSGQLVDAEDRPLQIVLRQPKTIHARVAYARKDRRLFPVATTNRSIFVNGTIRGAIITFRDVSEEYAVEHAKTELVTLASHQLRTPISAIKWQTELLLSGDAGPLSEEHREAMQQIYDSDARLATIVDAMLMVSNLELGNVPVHLAPTDLAALCRTLLADRLKKQAPEKKLTVHEQYSPDLPKVKLDAELTKIVFRNLIDNAIKYTPAGGSISINIEPSSERLSFASKSSIKATITDTGYGIPADQQKNIFAKMFRATNIKQKDTDGTGLGLYITKEVLKQTGGQITFESREGKGSKFNVLLPIEGMHPRQSPANASIFKDNKHRRQHA